MTYCIGVDAELNTPVCPLAKGDCYWQPTKTNACKYTERELTPQEFAELTARDVTNVEDLEQFRGALRASL